MATINNRVIQKDRIDTESNWLAASSANRTIYPGETIYAKNVTFDGSSFIGVKTNSTSSNQLFENVAYKYLFNADNVGVTGDIYISNTTPTLKLHEIDGDIANNKAWIKQGSNNFAVETRDNSNNLVHNLIIFSASTGYVNIPGVYNETTASSSNVFVSADGSLQRSTSSKKYKVDIEPLDTKFSEELLDKIELIFYRSLCKGDNKEWSWYGAIAEELSKIDPRYVFFGYNKDDYEYIYDKDSDTYTIVLKEGSELIPVGIQYERLVVPLIARSKIHKNKIEELESRIELLENMIKDLK